MDLTKSLAWVAFAAIVGVTGLGKDPSAKPASKPADSRPGKTQVAQRDSHKLVGPVTDRPVQLMRTSGP